MLLITPSKSKSVWSNINKQRIERLLKNGLMTTHGLSRINAAKRDGSWDTLTASNYAANTNELPKDVLIALKEKKGALNYFKAFSPSVRKQFIF